jgi:hypothetical protein
LFTISAVLTFGRFYLRWKKTYRFYWDDIFNALALGSLLIYMVTYQIFLPIDYNAELYELGIGGHLPTDEQWLYASDINTTNVFFFWITLYCVKGSLLALYWELFSVSSGFKKAWYIVTTYTGMTFLVTFISIFWICGSPRDIHNLGMLL